MGDDGAGVELAGAGSAGASGPGLVHLPAGDAVEGEALEDDVPGEVDLGGPARGAQHVDAAAQVAPAAKAWAWPPGWPLISQTRSTPSPPVSSQDPGHDVVAAGSRVTWAPIRPGEIAPRGIEVAGDDQRGPGGPGDPDREAARSGRSPARTPCCPAAPRLRARCGPRCPIGSMIAPIVGRDAVELHHVGGRHGDVVGEGAVAVDADDPGPTQRWE